MAHLWIEEFPGDWAVVPLQSRRVALTVPSVLGGGVVCPRGADDALGDADAALVNNGSDGHPAWHLIARPEAHVSINGLPLLDGMRVMTDRDEIRIAAGDAFFFSTEELARVVDMPATESPMTCPRCRQRIERGTLSVACPACGLWHHQSEELPCWTYAPTCALCPQSTALDAGFQWTPIDL